jgi:hypothetical protein
MVILMCKGSGPVKGELFAELYKTIDTDVITLQSFNDLFNNIFDICLEYFPAYCSEISGTEARSQIHVFTHALMKARTQCMILLRRTVFHSALEINTYQFKAAFQQNFEVEAD